MIGTNPKLLYNRRKLGGCITPPPPPPPPKSGQLYLVWSDGERGDNHQGEGIWWGMQLASSCGSTLHYAIHTSWWKRITTILPGHATRGTYSMWYQHHHGNTAVILILVWILEHRLT